MYTLVMGASILAAGVLAYLVALYLLLSDMH